MTSLALRRTDLDTGPSEPEQPVESARPDDNRLAQARAAAANVIDAVNSRPGVPEAIRDFVNGPWHRHLELTYARRGPDSAEWESVVAVTAQLILAADPSLFPADPTGPLQVFARIQSELDLGLAMTGLNASIREQLLQRVHACIEATSSRAAPARATVHTRAYRGNCSAPSAADHTYIEAARRVRIGSWVDFRPGNGEVIRAKLCWASAATGKRLFVNQQGLKFAEKTVDELAEDLMLQRAVLVG